MIAYGMCVPAAARHVANCYKETYTGTAVRHVTLRHGTVCHMVSQCYLPPGRGDIPAYTRLLTQCHCRDNGMSSDTSSDKSAGTQVII